MGSPHPRGKQGEEIAARFLAARAYTVMARNVHYRGGEIDIVAYDRTRREWVFVEVKARANRMFGWPEEGVDARKKQRWRHASSRYRAEHQEVDAYRFDIIAVELDHSRNHAQVVHYKNIEM